MKKNDIAVLIMIVSVSGMLGYAVGQLFLGNKTAQPVSVPVANAIDTTVVPPNGTIFNSKAINPTVKITISDNKNNPIGN